MLTRSVRDSAVALDATWGLEPGDPFFLPPPCGAYRDDVERDPSRLRIAVTAAVFNGVEVDASCVAAVDEAAGRCAELGHEILETAPPIDVAAFEHHFEGLWPAYADWIRIDWEERTGRTVVDGDFDRIAWTLAELGRNQSAGQYLKHVQEVQRTARVVGRFFDDANIDALLTPVAAVPPLPLGSSLGRRGPLTASMPRLHDARERHRPAGDVGTDVTRRRRTARGRSLHRPLR